MTLGVVMDPLARLKMATDSTLAMLQEAHARAWPIYSMEQRDLFLRDGKIWASMQQLSYANQQFNVINKIVQPIANLDAVLMRTDPPVDQNYIYTTYLLEQAEAEGVLIVNSPQALRDANEKLFTAWFPQCCPPTLVTSNHLLIREFLKEHNDIICKPLDGMAGRSIFRVRESDPNLSVILETLTENGAQYTMAQRYIPEISAGDKRILLINGEPVAHALARIPAPGETRGNLAAGGRGVAVPLTDRDRWICEQVGPTLRAKKLLFVGLDVIGDYLTEINVTSPTGIRQLDEQCGINISKQLLDEIEKLLGSA